MRVCERLGVSERRACRVLGQARSTQRHPLRVRADEPRLVARIVELAPFPDVLAALARLRARYRLAILSNGDRDMLEAAAPHIGFDFDRVISVQEAGYFKPHRATYAKAAELLDEDRYSIMMVANHAFDCIGAKAYGMRSGGAGRTFRPVAKPRPSFPAPARRPRPRRRRCACRRP